MIFPLLLCCANVGINERKGSPWIGTSTQMASYKLHRRRVWDVALITRWSISVELNTFPSFNSFELLGATLSFEPSSIPLLIIYLSSNCCRMMFDELVYPVDSNTKKAPISTSPKNSFQTNWISFRKFVNKIAFESNEFLCNWLFNPVFGKRAAFLDWELSLRDDKL